jgi:hypothetical protein
VHHPKAPLPRRAAALLAIVATASSLSLGAAPALSAGHHYPATLKKSFLKSCASTAVDAAQGKLTKHQAAQYCALALSCIEAKLTLKEFEQTVQNMQSGKANPNAKVLTKCEKQAISKVM